MKPPPFDYVEPQDLPEAVAILSSDDEARPLAGGQSLVPMLNFRLAAPSTLVGLRRIAALGGIERGVGGLRIGAMVTQRQALASDEVRAASPLLSAALARIGHPQIRSRGTVGGSIAHADPAAELPAALLALDGSVTACGPHDTRTIAARDLFAGPYTTSLRPGEIITEVRAPVPPPRTGAVCIELTRRRGDFATAGAVCQVSLDEDGGVAEARIALFAVAGVPIRARAVEEAVTGRPARHEAFAAAAELAADGLPGRSGADEQAGYRASVVPVIVRRALAGAAEAAT